MKNTKKILVLALAAVLLVSATFFATMAYLTSKTDEVNNTFTVGKVKIDLDEAKVDENGKAQPNEARVKANDYHLLPGHDYDKDPTVKVLANSEKSYVRMFLTFDKKAELEALQAKLASPLALLAGMDDGIWVPFGAPVVDGNKITYEFRYYQAVEKAGADQPLEPLFTQIQVPNEMLGDEMETLADMHIDAVAEAIQADGFDDAAAAWNALDNPTP